MTLPELIDAKRAKRATEGASNQRDTDEYFARWTTTEDDETIVYVKYKQVNNVGDDPKIGIKTNMEVNDEFFQSHVWNATETESDAPRDLLEVQATRRAPRGETRRVEK